MQEPRAIDRLFEDLYAELRSLARAQLRRDGGMRPLQTTTLVHESYVKLREDGRVSPEDERHFLAYASHVMRSVVVDHARRQVSAKRGSGQVPAPLDTNAIESVTATDEQVLKVHEAVQDLAAVEPRLAQIVEMKYFAGLKEEEIALALDLGVRTVQRDWEKARLMLGLLLAD